MQMNLSDELVQGAIDTHCHAYPEFSTEFPCRYTPEEHIALMVEKGMKGVVLKSHVWPTMALAELLRPKFPDFNIFSSITLNDGVGGMVPWAVESAAKQNAKMVWLPTWSAQNDIERGGISRTIAKYVPTFQQYIDQGGHRLVDEEGHVRREVLDVLAVCREYDLVVSTGHNSPQEALAVAKSAADMGFKKLVLCHPDSNSVKANMEQIAEFARLGGYVELCALGLTPMHYRITPAQFGEIVKLVGPDRCILSTDYFFAWDASSPEQLRALVNALLFAGISPEDIRMMATQTPSHLLGIS